MKIRFPALPKLALGLALATGLTSSFIASAQPAQAGVVVSVGVGGAYAPGYHWYRWRDGYGWHRRWVPLGWAAPVAYAPWRGYAYPAPVFYGRPAYWHRDRDDWRWHDWR